MPMRSCSFSSQKPDSFPAFLPQAVQDVSNFRQSSNTVDVIQKLSSPSDSQQHTSSPCFHWDELLGIGLTSTHLERLLLKSHWFSMVFNLSFTFHFLLFWKHFPKISAKCKISLQSFNPLIWCARHPWTRSVVTMGRFSCADATSHSDATSRHPKSWRIVWHQNLSPKVKVEMANPKIRLNREVLPNVCWRFRSWMWRYIQY